MQYKKLRVLTLSSAIAFSSLLPYTIPVDSVKANAVVTDVISVSESAQVDSSDSSKISESSESIDKQLLIDRVRELFPSKFDFVSDNDFNLGFAHYRPYEEEEDIQRYRLEFFKKNGSGNHIHGNFEFVGEDLKLSEFYYRPENQTDALFPPKVSKEQAKEIAAAFIQRAHPNTTYELKENDHYYYRMNRPLTEPIEYNFHFEKVINDIPVQNQSVRVNVLGNGDITNFHGSRLGTKATFESNESMITEEDALNQWKANLNADLAYIIKRDNEKSEAVLAYVETPFIQGMDAVEGKFLVNREYVAEPKVANDEIIMVAKEPKPASPITKEGAEALAKQLLEPKKGNAKLVIEGVLEQENHNKEKVYEIRYMYHSQNGGHGSSIQINKETGELVQFHGIRDYEFEAENTGEETPSISEEKALEKAVSYIENYAYTNMDQFALPSSSEPTFYNNHLGQYEYRFVFPRVKNGKYVQSDNIYITVSKEDGDLISLNKNFTDIENWPSEENIVSKEEAIDAFKEKLNINLYYVNESHLKDSEANETNHFELRYLPNQEYRQSFFHAQSGEWEERYPTHPGNVDRLDKEHISHPWAEDELNFMIDANIIKVEDVEEFTADNPITKGEALEVLSKSLTRIYDHHYRNPNTELVSPFENIETDHPLFTVIQRSVEIGILDDSKKVFPVEEAITREELAYWFIRALKLEEVAKHKEIFQYDFTDANQVDEKYKGYVVLTNALGLLTSDNGGKFHPKQEVTLAQLAVSNLRLAKKVTEMETQYRY